MQQAQTSVELFAKAQAKAQLLVLTSAVEIERWSRPQCNDLKANWDAAWEGQTRTMVVGVVMRDWLGKVVVAIAENFPHSSDPTQAEAQAAWRAISFCHELGIRRVHFEGDSLNIVSALQREEPYWTRFRHLVNDSKLLFQYFGLVTVRHCRRTANLAAHSLAKFALAQRVNCVWTLLPSIMSFLRSKSSPLD